MADDNVVPFKMAPKPEDLGDTAIHRLFGDELRRAEALAGAFNRLEEVMHEPPERPTFNAETLANGRVNELRAFDLHFDYASYRPEAERWHCIDLNTYDGAPDSQAPCTFIGRGKSEHESRMDLLEQFRDYDEEPKPRAGYVVHSSAFEPPTVIDIIDRADEEE